MQLVVTTPPLLEVAIEISREAEISVKFPPVELESVTIALVAFVVKVSANEPDLTIKSIAGEVSEMVISAL